MPDMINCPFCGKENIEGTDACDGCGQSLSDLHLPAPRSRIEVFLLHDRVSLLRPNQPVTVSPRTPVGEVLRIMVERSIGCSLVVANGKLVGIFTERDALRKLNIRAAELADRPVEEFMTANVESLAPTAKIAFAVQRMDLGGFRHVPIISEDSLPEGLISARDILRYMTERIAAQEEE